ncbi:MAG: hypothetical protein KDC44_09060 [Phaeodactylibacter sp.]|nr:hypothetical protein [Phaeodactylibacter sp.]
MTRYLQEKTLYPPLIGKRPSINLGLVVVIPAYKERYLLLSLMALKKCRLPDVVDVEVIILINEPRGCDVDVSELNRASFEQCSDWAKIHSRPRLHFYPIYLRDLPLKYAGVGLARKIGMDEACYRLEKAGNPKGVIACFDADSRCSPDYLQVVTQAFEAHPDWQAAGIHFEHPLSGADFPDAVYEAIVEYELHLRYYIQAQRWAGFPFAYQTIGSSMAVRATAYQAQGGMNRKKAGEDFYFLQKFIELGAFGEIHHTKVIPSPRPSDRVPFGTGRAVGKQLQEQGEWLTYAPESFVAIQAFFQIVPKLYQPDLDRMVKQTAGLPAIVKDFLTDQEWPKEWARIRQHTASAASFEKQFYRWFNAFKLMKFLHFARESGHAEVPVSKAAAWLLQQCGRPVDDVDKRSLLAAYRRWDLGA